MSPRRRAGKKLLKALLPIVLLLVLVVVAAVGWVVYGVTHPKQRGHLVTPGDFSQLSNRGLKVTDETWPNLDGTQARGWLLRGAPGAPAVVLLHRYGANRSWLLNLGVKLNETTNFTVLWPDLRGHGENPPVAWASFGGREAEDTMAALDYLRTLKTAQGQQLVGSNMGLYGTEVGAYAALLAAVSDASVRALVLDSVPAGPDEALRAAVRERMGLENSFVQWLARGGMRLYFLGDYKNTPACEAASTLSDQQVLLLTGADADHLRNSTTALAQCFSNRTSVEVKNDLPLTGFNLPSATGEQEEIYDRRVIDFFDKALRASR